MATLKSETASLDQVLDGWREQGIRYVRFELPDMHGTSRSKTVPLEHAGRYAESGLNMYGGTVVLDTRSDIVAGTLYNEEVAYADQRLKPDPETACVIPWVEATGRLICDTFWDDDRPLGAAPRHVFRRVLERSHELGYEPLIGIEPEFYVLEPETRQPLFRGYHIFNTVRNAWVPLIQRIVDESRALGIDIITANSEYAGSQWEINYSPAAGMSGPDQAYTFKNAVKELAHLEGYIATFMSKPFPDSAGCGAHNHITLLDLDGGENALSDDDGEYGLSAVGRSFIAGQLRHAR
jgi:glutamine synthetase